MTRARRRLRYLIAAFGALALTAQLGINSPEAEASTDLRFWHFNMCGNVCWQPDAPHNYLPGTDSRGEVTVRAAQIVESVGNYSPDIVTLNEACYSQYRGIRAALVAQGYHATYASSGTGGQCDDYDASEGNGFGMALFSKQPIAAPRETHNLGTAANPNLLLCADTALGSRPVKACSVHLTAASAEQRAFQATNLAALASGWHATKPVVLMGDFNAEPLDPVMAKFYSHSGGEGIFHEADESDADYSASWPAGAVRGRSGEITFSSEATSPPTLKKIDYIFLSGADFRAVEGDSLYGGERRISDHRVYRGGAAWQ
ncbi:hypothetical protein GCM10009654_47050 [Streptomyces hebeiensis]|uniref:Endonuclease/exonuclease/phosphatase domain-containing protein n=1 Tax=Streptomyces hebeiensis TaxID=229486 RepID=A0ABP4FM39_9ACTN